MDVAQLPSDEDVAQFLKNAKTEYRHLDLVLYI